MRWKDGAFHRPAPERRLPVEDGLVRWSLSADAGAWRLRLEPEALPAATRPVERRGLVAVNEFRNRTGLAPLALDLAWCSGCQKHADYIRFNPVDGFGHSEIEGRPGYSRAGLEAAIEGVMERTSDPASAVRRLTAMMMHRTPFLTDTSVGVGVGAVGAGVEYMRDAPTDAPGYCVLRVGQALTSHAFPVLVPGPGQQDVPLLIRPEIPIPDRHPDAYDSPRGYPISVSYLDGKRRIQALELRVKGRLETLPAFVFTPQEPIHAQFAHNYATAFLMTEAPLEPRTTYEARCTLGEGAAAQVLVWHFTTVRL